MLDVKELPLAGGHVHTFLLIFLRIFSHSSGSLAARAFCMADSSVLFGNRLPHFEQFSIEAASGLLIQFS